MKSVPAEPEFTSVVQQPTALHALAERDLERTKPPGEHVHVQAVSLGVVGQRRPGKRRELLRRGAAPVDRLSIDPKPLAVVRKALEGAIVELASRRRPDVHDDVAAL